MMQQRQIFRVFHWIILAAAFLMMPAFQPLRADEPSREQQITDIQKQIDQLNKKLDDLKQTKSNDPAAKGGAISPEWIKTMTWRCIGPAAMGEDGQQRRHFPAPVRS